MNGPWDPRVLERVRHLHLHARQAVAGLSTEQVRARPVAGKWSVLEVVCHLADFEPIYADRMKRVLAEDEPLMMSGDPDRFAAKLAYHQRDLEEELRLIESVRGQMVRILQTAGEADFQRCGRHSRSEEHTSELQSPCNLVCRLLLEKKK